MVRWDERLAGFFDDLEQQAEGLALADRDVEVAEALRAEYTQVDLASRLLASVGAPLRMTVTGVGRIEGLLSRAGDGWCLLDSGTHDWVVRVAVVTAMRGLADRSSDPRARPVTARLGLGSVLRGLAESRTETLLHRVDGSLLRGLLGRVGADFVEVADGDGSLDLVPFPALAAVRSC